jgi:hypothetical protein
VSVVKPYYNTDNQLELISTQPIESIFIYFRVKDNSISKIIDQFSYYSFKPKIPYMVHIFINDNNNIVVRIY